MKEKILIVEDQFVEAEHLKVMLSKEGYQVLEIAKSVLKAQEIMKNQRPDLVLLDIFLKGKQTGIDLAHILQGNNIPFVYLSANSDEEILSLAKATQPYGFLVKPFREKDLLVTLEIARYRHEHSIESTLLKEAVLKSQLAEIFNGNGRWEEKLLSIAKVIQSYIPFDFLSVGNYTAAIYQPLNFLRIGFDEYQVIGNEELSMITNVPLRQLTDLRSLSQPEGQSTIFNGDDFAIALKSKSLKNLFASSFNLQSHLSLPLRLQSGEVFDFSFYSRRGDAYHADHLSLIGRLERGWTKSIEAMVAAKGAPAANHQALKSTNSRIDKFEGIIGKSHLMLNILDQVTMVAPSDTSVLILGESGTGKEKIADVIHKLSPRKNNAFIKVNCAALPPTLIESELFGHEKGAFTNAFDKRIGKFEQADTGTIFLDEIGELSLEFQAKLLRVLQEKEVERIGAKSITKVDVRIIAATNRNLEKEVAEGRFRLDLYYRLNVFPLELPALRDRKADLAELANHFRVYYSKKAGKKITSISEKALEKINAYDWPGNIRELENLIARMVLITNGDTIEDISLPGVKPKVAPTGPQGSPKTIRENERDHILAVLKQANGRVWGPGGAAEILNIPPSTLKSKMTKLGIRKEYVDE